MTRPMEMFRWLAGAIAGAAVDTFVREVVTAAIGRARERAEKKRKKAKPAPAQEQVMMGRLMEMLEELGRTVARWRCRWRGHRWRPSSRGAGELCERCRLWRPSPGLPRLESPGKPIGVVKNAEVRDGALVAEVQMSPEGYALLKGLIPPKEPAVPGDVVLRWYCGHGVGPPTWQGTEAYEPDECGMEFDTIEDPEEVENGDASATCPRCGAELNMLDDEPRIINEGQEEADHA